MSPRPRRRRLVDLVREAAIDVCTYPVPDAHVLCPTRFGEVLLDAADASLVGGVDPAVWETLRLMYRTVYESRVRRCPCGRCATARSSAARRRTVIRAQHIAEAAHALRRSSTPRSTTSTPSGRSDA